MDQEHTPRAILKRVIKRLDALEKNTRSQTPEARQWTREGIADEVRAIRWHVNHALETNEGRNP